MLDNCVMFSIQNRLNDRDFNIIKKNHYFEFFHNRAAPALRTGATLRSRVLAGVRGAGSGLPMEEKLSSCLRSSRDRTMGCREPILYL